MENILRNQYGETVDPTQPVPVDTAEAQRLTAMTDAITYNGKAAAGAISINSTTYKPIISIEGDQVGSHWELEKNKVFEAKIDSTSNQDPFKLKSIVETDGAAVAVIYNSTADMEKLMESVTGTVKRYVLKVTDNKGKSLYGWIFGVAVSGSVYTFDIVNNRLTETRNWVGVLANFDHLNMVKVEIYRYNSSLTFGTGTTATEEVVCPREYSKSWKSVLKFASENLTAGQYVVDYMRGRIITCKADTTASEALAYNIWASTTVGGGTGGLVTTNITQLAGQTLKQGVTIASSVVSGEQNVLADAIYRTTTLSKIDGQVSPVESDSAGNLKGTDATQMAGEDLTEKLVATQNKPVAVPTYAWLIDKSAALEASTITKATAGNIRYASFRLDSTAPTATYYLQAINSATLPADGAVTLLTAPTKIIHTSGVNDSINLDYTMNTIHSTAGIVFVLSSTEFTKTISGAYLSGTVFYI